MRNPVLAICEQEGADQPAHLRSRICISFVCYLDSIISILAKSKISRL